MAWSVQKGAVANWRLHSSSDPHYRPVQSGRVCKDTRKSLLHTQKGCVFMTQGSGWRIQTGHVSKLQGPGRRVALDTQRLAATSSRIWNKNSHKVTSDTDRMKLKDILWMSKLRSNNWYTEKNYCCKRRWPLVARNMRDSFTILVETSLLPHTQICKPSGEVVNHHVMKSKN